MSSIKPSHHRRLRIANANTPALARHVTRASFAIRNNADTANLSLEAFVKLHGKASIGMLDPPWSMGRCSPSNSVGSVSPDLHYPTMTPKACREFNFGMAFEKDAVVGMWATMSQITLAIDMLRGQGFKPVTQVVWHKVRSGGGDATCPASGAVINCSEVLIIARRGRGLPIDRQATKFRSVTQALRTAHSEKPELFREVLAKLYPRTWSGKRSVKLELFARMRALGWLAWGNQAPKKVGGARITLRRVTKLGEAA